MRIVSNIPHPSVVRELICTNCGVTLEYVPADIEERIEKDYTGGTDRIHFITCPSCKVKINVNKY